MSDVLKKLEDKIRCAFCLNFGPKNPKQVGEQGTAYLCDDCNKAGYHPKFVHHVEDDKVIEVEVPQPQPQPQQQQKEIKNTEEQQRKAPLSDEMAKQIAKAIEVDKEEDLE